MSEVQFENSDAWLLLAIIMASSNQPADLSEIIGVGDLINHAVFTEDELNGGLTRLINKDYIKEHGELVFTATDKILIPYKEYTSKSKSIRTLLEFVEKSIGAKNFELNYDLKKANDGYKYPGVNEIILEKAYKSNIKRRGLTKLLLKKLIKVILKD